MRGDNGTDASSWKLPSDRPATTASGIPAWTRNKWSSKLTSADSVCASSLAAAACPEGGRGKEPTQDVRGRQFDGPSFHWFHHLNQRDTWPSSACMGRKHQTTTARPTDRPTTPAETSPSRPPFPTRKLLSCPPSSARSTLFDDKVRLPPTHPSSNLLLLLRSLAVPGNNAHKSDPSNKHLRFHNLGYVRYAAFLNFCLSPYYCQSLSYSC